MKIDLLNDPPPKTTVLATVKKKKKNPWGWGFLTYIGFMLFISGSIFMMMFSNGKVSRFVCLLGMFTFFIGLFLQLGTILFNIWKDWKAKKAA